MPLSGMVDIDWLLLLLLLSQDLIIMSSGDYGTRTSSSCS
jgi:hypothetical protein